MTRPVRGILRALRKGVLPAGAAFLLASVLWACGTPYALRHRVGPGETLGTIASRYGVPEPELRRFNRLEPGDRVRPGDILFVPGPLPERAAPAQGPGPEVSWRSVPPRAPPVPPKPAPGPGRVTVPGPPGGGPPARLSWPVEGAVLRGFGQGPAGASRGLDIAAEPGTPVRAAAPGEVTYAGTPAPAYGGLVILRHGADLYTVYGNLSSVKVRVGQRVRGGSAVGLSGRERQGLPPHLHFEVRRGERPVDPALLLPRR